MFEDDDLPRNQPKKPRDLSPLSVGELEAYTEELKTEIARVEAEITKKKAHQDAVSGLFKS